jgi:sodium transport system permease protein
MKRWQNMSFKKAMIVYRKEFLEMLRDKRTIFTTLVLPVVMYPLLFMGFSAIMSRQSDILEKRGANVAFQDSLQFRDKGSLAIRDSIFSGLYKMPNLSVSPAPPTVEKLYQEKDILAIVTVTDSMSRNGIPFFKIKVRYDKSNERGRLLFGRIESKILEVGKAEISRRLKERSVDPELIKPFAIKEEDTSTAQKKMGSILGMFLPYLMILTLVAGAATIAADIVAGEKERRTLETLLVSSATRSEIVLGKYLTIITMAMINVIINLVSLSVSVRFLVSQTGLNTQGLQMPISSFLILLAAMVPLATLFAALLLSISTFSRNMKEARTYEQPIMMVSMMLGMISFIPSIEINNLLALIPVVNISLLFKAVMINEYHLSHLLITVGSTLFLDVIAIWMTVRLFNTENVLFRTEDTSSIKNVRTNKLSFFNTYYGLMYYALALAGLYYIGGSLQKPPHVMNGLLQTEILLIFLPPLIILRLLKLKPKEILRLNAPKLKELAVVPFIALSGALISAMLAQFMDLIFPIPKEYLDTMTKLLSQNAPFWQLLGVFALAPAFCEEILFRGFLMRFYESYGKVVAVVATALLFAVFHLDPFKIVSVLFMGIVLGYLLIRTNSIYNSMLAHFLNNALALVIVNNAGAIWLKPFLKDGANLQWWVIAPAILIFVASIYIFHKLTAQKEIA